MRDGRLMHPPLKFLKPLDVIKLPEDQIKNWIGVK